MTDVNGTTGRVVDMLEEHGCDLAKFRKDVLNLASETARDISATLDAQYTAQLKAALQFLFSLADGAGNALEAHKGNASPEGADESVLPLDL